MKIKQQKTGRNYGHERFVLAVDLSTPPETLAKLASHSCNAIDITNLKNLSLLPKEIAATLISRNDSLSLPHTTLLGGLEFYGYGELWVPKLVSVTGHFLAPDASKIYINRLRYIGGQQNFPLNSVVSSPFPLKRPHSVLSYCAHGFLSNTL